MLAEPASITGDYLAGRRKIPTPASRRGPNGSSIEVLGATENNLQEIDVRFPLGLFVTVTGVSGSGKSSLVQEILSKSLHHALYRSREVPGRHKKVVGVEQHRQGHQHRPVTDRPHPPLQSGHLHQGLRPRPDPLRLDSRCPHPRLPAGPLLLQRQGRPLRGLQRGRHHQDRDALPARRIRAV